MNRNCAKRKVFRSKSSTKGSSIEKVHAQTRIRSLCRGKKIADVSFRSFCLFFLLVLATYTYVHDNRSHSDSDSNKTILLSLHVPAIITASAMRTATTVLRRSARLRGISAAMASSSSSSSQPQMEPNKRQRRNRSNLSSDSAAVTKNETARNKRTKTVTKNDTAKRTTKTRAKEQTKRSSGLDSEDGAMWCLPRTQETSILSSSDAVHLVMGVDEAGRGPLAGPVVAAAAIVPSDIHGITDSKKITKEKDREDLYEAIVISPKVRWAVAVMDAPFIDKVNILQATMRGMSAAATALVTDAGPPSIIKLGELEIPIVSTLTIEQKGCYLITSKSANGGSDGGKNEKPKVKEVMPEDAEIYCALVDGNRVPPDMPCVSHSIVKGDSKEYAIAAASILAKVTRDRLMRDYHNLWPHFGLEQHKGYPTAAHMQAVRTFGASPIHRRTFKPLKDMTFDENGKIVE